MTMQEALSLRLSQVIYDGQFRNRDHSPRRWRVSGKTQMWKTRPGHVTIPLKSGPYTFGYLTQDNMSQFFLSSQEASRKRQGQVKFGTC